VKAYRFLSTAERNARDQRIREKWAMGWSRRELAQAFELTPQRVDQIVKAR
jgi:plasmid maintenance system antidote protein VapI